MIVRQSHLFGTPLRVPPKDAETVSHRLLLQGGFIHQLAAGIFSLLPLGFRVHQRIIAIIREEMLSLGAEEVLLPSLQPKALWEETGRWTDIDPPLFTITDRHDRTYALAPTHEEVITDLARTHLHSYKQLPVSLFQIHTKFRNEQRPTGGLLRTREFFMKDLYSFHATQEDLEAFYERAKQAYITVFQRCGIETVPVRAESGSIGGPVSHEFALLADTGEDKVAQCASCGFGAKRETLANSVEKCPECDHGLTVKNCIESGHIFQLGQKYSKVMNASFTTEKGTKEVFAMGCYGIGVGRLLAAIVEASHDEKGIIWPASVAPFDAQVIALKGAGSPKSPVGVKPRGGHVPLRGLGPLWGRESGVGETAERVATTLADAGKSVLHDDRDNASVGEKFADADLIGIPWRIVVSDKHVAAGTVGIKKRNERDEVAVRADVLLDTLQAG